MAGTLFLIPNTLGKRDESDPVMDVIPAGVQQIAARLDYLVAENAKTARAFLKKLGETAPLAHAIQQIEIRELNVNTKADALDALLDPIAAGRDGGLLSEAGVPAVADPGADLVRLAHSRGITVRPLVGPSSILLAVMGSGLNGQSFAFNGYLPVDAAERARRLRELEQHSRKARQTQVWIETPYRNGALLDALRQHCSGTTLLSIAIDLTLPTETIVTLPISAWRPDRLALHKRPAIFSLLAV
ncbi:MULTISPECIES: SAM-dependent methyltransferase [unclassified Cupriavidus]|jgi:16S rRNA (cytidine1402-2'-O)-methyltransferase|uniref:SAM-dependent methyltransferase n=1 Tax=unclassified Cupriavidus TaxID=2640874 RepID=UPI001C006412|nr:MULTISPECIES: SAM-dependent methyltransferase [unclassified Cupriavidus]MCA3191013.1 SAM-dependent methyltransferase [Cupriavidus sp.]MCA3199357.1 SAM-dependent methyltransferase [Cupriavidus sp.]MCA3204624.1 SAM-dependent methyltransferase [Cupriavidus sp.]MCA3206490.1 SAM-dependent methyltransferase [Cupriavidus sp.]QWE93565.1 SAM-dependent methyltransferase [Cupriavidus sp. EM10]